ncbi:MAG: sigma 54-interacting transcriptional regulator, partial [Gemmatimonadetes bacterium]|nr:sigma 54-interacting transcriptional regulator [Gemmatimonadota bacterium]
MGTNWKIPRGYELKRVLKESRVQTVRHVMRGSDDSHWVLKMLASAAGHAVRERFEADARIRAEHEHEGIAPASEFRRNRHGQLYHLTPFVRRMAPARWVARDPDRRFPLLAGRLLDTLAFLHERGLVHGDIKTDNLLFRSHRDEIRVLQLTDFLPPSLHASVGSMSGTPAYMAPEILQGARADHRSDFYSLGVLLYEAWYDRLPFLEKGDALAAAHLGSPPPFPSGKDEAPGNSITLLQNLLEKNPMDRPQSAAAALAILTGRKVSKRVSRVAPSPSFIGREDLFRTIRIWRERDEYMPYLIVGAPGIGKTRFLQQLRRKEKARGGAVMSVTLQDHWDAPLAGIQAMLEAAGEERFAENLKRFIQSRESAGTDAAEIGERTYHRQLALQWEKRLFRRDPLAGRKPLVLIDDLQQWDRSSLQFLRVLLTRNRERVQFVLASRDAAAGPTGSALRALGNEARLERMKPLEEDEITPFVQSMLGRGDLTPSFRTRLLAKTGGVPGRMEQELRSAIQEGSIERRFGTLHLRRAAGRLADRSPAEGPASAEYDDPDGAAIVRVLAAVRDRAERAVIAAGTGRPEETLREPLEKLERQGIVIRLEGAGRAGDRYLLASGALQLPPAKPEAVTGLHATLHRYYDAIDSIEAKRRAARHALLAGDEEAAAALLEGVARGLRAGRAFREAEEIYPRLLRLPSIRGGERVQEFLFEWASVSGQYGAARRSQRLFRVLSRHARARSETTRWSRQAERKLAWAQADRGRYERARSLFDGILSDPAVDAEERGDILCDRGWCRLVERAWAEAEKDLREALAIAEEIDSDHLRGVALNRLGTIRYYSGEIAEAEEYYRAALKALRRDRSGDKAGVLANLALIAESHGRFKEATQRLNDAITAAAHAGIPARGAHYRRELGRLLIQIGDWDEADRELTAAEEVLEDFEDLEWLVRVRASRLRIALQRGRLGTALTLAHDAERVARDAQDPGLLFEIGNLRGQVHVARREPVAASRVLEELEALERGGIGDYARYFVSYLRAGVTWLAGDLEAADRAFLEAIEAATALGHEHLRSPTVIDRARFLVEAGRVEEAKESVSTERKQIRSARNPLFLGRERFVRGLIAFEEGHLDRALRQFREAAASFRKLDARIDLAMTCAHIARVQTLTKSHRSAARYVDDATRLYGLIGFAEPPPFFQKLQSETGGGSPDTSESFRAICRVSEAINTIYDTDRILEIVLDNAVDYLGADRGLVFEIRENGRLVPKAARSLDQEYLEDLTKLSRTILQAALSSDRPLVSTNAAEDPRFAGSDSIVDLHILSVIYAPIQFRGEAIGVIYLDNMQKTSVFQESDRDFLQALANQAAVALTNARLIHRLHTEKQRLTGVESGAGRTLIGTSRAIHAVREETRHVAASEIPVLILGEPGTGKGLVAETVHDLSMRSNGPFERVNLAAAAPNRLEALLFGRARAGGRDGNEDRPGVFDAAEGGTLFLDEIADLPIGLQPKLLRVLQEGIFERKGGVEPVSPDVRIVCATNADLEDRMARGVLRPDLYFRLNAFPIRMPALRERVEDLVPLSEHFLHESALKNGKSVTSFSPEVIRIFAQYDWPGNVRELEAVIENCVVRGSGARVEVSLLPDRFLQSWDVTEEP